MCLMLMREHACRQVGQAVLGSLKPKVLVVTTPNREYNPILQHLGNSLIPPNNTRNSDHQFEWYCPLPPFIATEAGKRQMHSICLESVLAPQGAMYDVPLFWVRKKRLRHIMMLPQGSCRVSDLGGRDGEHAQLRSDIQRHWPGARGAQCSAPLGLAS